MKTSSSLSGSSDLLSEEDAPTRSPRQSAAELEELALQRELEVTRAALVAAAGREGAALRVRPRIRKMTEDSVTLHVAKPSSAVDAYEEDPQSTDMCLDQTLLQDDVEEEEEDEAPASQLDFVTRGVPAAVQRTLESPMVQDHTLYLTPRRPAVMSQPVQAIPRTSYPTPYAMTTTPTPPSYRGAPSSRGSLSMTPWVLPSGPVSARAEHATSGNIVAVAAAATAALAVFLVATALFLLRGPGLGDASAASQVEALPAASELSPPPPPPPAVVVPAVVAPPAAVVVPAAAPTMIAIGEPVEPTVAPATKVAPRAVVAVPKAAVVAAPTPVKVAPAKVAPARTEPAPAPKPKKSGKSVEELLNELGEQQLKSS